MLFIILKNTYADVTLQTRCTIIFKLNAMVMEQECKAKQNKQVKKVVCESATRSGYISGMEIGMFASKVSDGK